MHGVCWSLALQLEDYHPAVVAYATNNSSVHLCAKNQTMHAAKQIASLLQMLWDMGNTFCSCHFKQEYFLSSCNCVPFASPNYTFLPLRSWKATSLAYLLRTDWGTDGHWEPKTCRVPFWMFAPRSCNTENASVVKLVNPCNHWVFYELRLPFAKFQTEICVPFGHVPDTDALVLGVAHDQFLSRVEQAARHIVVVTATCVHFPGFSLCNAHKSLLQCHYSWERSSFMSFCLIRKQYFSVSSGRHFLSCLLDISGDWAKIPLFVRMDVNSEKETMKFTHSAKYLQLAGEK